MSDIPLPQPKGPELSSGKSSKIDSSTKPHKPDVRRREKSKSPFKVPDNYSIVHEKSVRKEELRKFLSLPIEEKTAHTAQILSKQRREFSEQLEEDEEETPTNSKQTKSKVTPPKEIPGRHELKMAMIKQRNMKRDSKHELISMGRQKAVLDISLMTKRAEILKMDKAIAKEERQLNLLEKTIEKDNRKFEEFLKENERKSVEARTCFEREAKSRQEKNAEIRKLTSEIGTIKSELAKFEETLQDYKRYKELLFKLSPPEWQEAQRAKPLNKVRVDDTTEDEHEGSAHGQGLASSADSELPSRVPDSDSSQYEDEPELYFTDPQQLLDLMAELTEQNLSLIQHSTRVEEKLEVLHQSMETARKKLEKDEEHMTLQIKDMNQRIDLEKARAARLARNVELHMSLNTVDQEKMLEVLGKKVAEVHHSCVDDRMNSLSTIEKLASIENHVYQLMQSIDSIPEENLKMMQKIKDSERRTRQREEKLREQKEKQQERMKKYLERALADAKKPSGRKQMPKYVPITRKVKKVKKVEKVAVEDELHAYLFTSDDVD